MLCGLSDRKYLERLGGLNFPCGHIVCWLCSTMHCSVCVNYQVTKGYPDGRLPNAWPIMPRGCIICNSREHLPCGEKYKDCSNITPPL